jgi:hypothetical protein
VSDRLDFRLARIEKRVFGTQTPTSGTASGVTLATPDLITRIAVLESQLAASSAYLTGSGEPASTLGKNGDTYWDSVGLYEWRKVGGTWRQQQ